MKCYELILNEGATPEYHATLALAKAETKVVPKGMRDQVFIDEVEVPTSKENVLLLLNGGGVITKLRSWGLTARGGLELQVAT